MLPALGCWKVKAGRSDRHALQLHLCKPEINATEKRIQPEGSCNTATKKIMKKGKADSLAWQPEKQLLGITVSVLSSP